MENFSSVVALKPIGSGEVEHGRTIVMTEPFHINITMIDRAVNDIVEKRLRVMTMLERQSGQNKL